MDEIYVKLTDFMKELEGLRTRILYDSSVVKDLLIFQHIIPSYSDRNLYLVLYSEALYHKFCRRAEYLMFTNSSMAKILDNINIIKVGHSDDINFGKLYAFIEHSTPREEFVTLMETLRHLDRKSVLILYSSVAYIMSMLNEKEALRLLLESYGILPRGITIFGFKHLKTQTRIDYYINDLYDVLITIRRDESSFDYSTYIFEAECQLSDVCYKTCRLRVDNGRLIQI
ncbi:hypothetical protein [Archaeoglobus sp.]